MGWSYSVDNKKNIRVKAGLVLTPIIGPLAAVGLVASGAEKVAKMQIVMDNYIKKTTEFCIECGKDYIDEY